MVRPKIFIILFSFLLIWLITSGISNAASDTKSLIVKADVGKFAKLIFETNSITFNNMDPDEMQKILRFKTISDLLLRQGRVAQVLSP